MNDEKGTFPSARNVERARSLAHPTMRRRATEGVRFSSPNGAAVSVRLHRQLESIGVQIRIAHASMLLTPDKAIELAQAINDILTEEPGWGQRDYYGDGAIQPLRVRSYRMRDERGLYLTIGTAEATLSRQMTDELVVTMRQIAQQADAGPLTSQSLFPTHAYRAPTPSTN